MTIFVGLTYTDDGHYDLKDNKNFEIIGEKKCLRDMEEEIFSFLFVVGEPILSGRLVTNTPAMTDLWGRVEYLPH